MILCVVFCVSGASDWGKAMIHFDPASDKISLMMARNNIDNESTIYDATLTHLLAACPDPHDSVVLDVGANLGLVFLRAALLAFKQVG